MVAFVTHGPDIPEHLLQAHEEGNVVFFCGAGISYPAGLPGFKGLVEKIYRELGASPNTVQQVAIDAGQFDTAIGLLEIDILGGREKVRGAISRILTPTATSSKSTATHNALLTLARNRDRRMRIITTNFDRLFEDVIGSSGREVERFKAPLLPVPKNRWDGLVYLHGLLPSVPRAPDFDRIVVSSGDFGLAYLTERWAARFVSELFRNYSVCFVGYSINDPVLRYMMDALAADRLLGESPPEMFAFGDYAKGKDKQTAAEWQAKNVTPILYRKHKKHAYLHETLCEWANTYRDGVSGKKMIIAQHASTPPLAPSRSDFAVGRVLWALTDEQAAQHFADLNPAPPLEWLEALSEEQFEHRDLARFGMAASRAEDKTPNFSMLRRPTPYLRSPPMSIFDTGGQGNQWDNVMRHLARWLTRHLGDPKLILWLAKRGGQLHQNFMNLVNNQLVTLSRLVVEGNQVELDRISENSPNAIPDLYTRTLWRLLLTGRLSSHTYNADLYNWFRRIAQDGVTPSLRMELREILAPCVTLRANFNWSDEIPAPPEPKRTKDIVGWDLELRCYHVHTKLCSEEHNPQWLAALPDFLQDFTMLLRDALSLSRELSGEGEQRGFSFIYQPSISEHSQNKDSRDWTALIALTRDAWLATAKTNPARARSTAESWWQEPYPLFKRLALFAAAQNGLISQRQALDWILADKCQWLWADEARREVLRLLVALAPKLNASELADLVHAILADPPQETSEAADEQGMVAGVRDWPVWLRLAKLQAAGATLEQTIGKTRLDKLTQQYPDWRLADDQQDEFPFFFGSVGTRDLRLELTPHHRHALVKWLKEPSNTDRCEESDWRQRCSDDFRTTAYALCALAKDGVWPKNPWREAFEAWSEDKITKRSWRYMGPLLIDMPDDFAQSLSRSLSGWLQSIAKTIEVHEALFLDLCWRILSMAHQDGALADDDPFFRAINHPVGHATQALLNWWYRGSPEDGQGLPVNLQLIFTALCNTQIEQYRHGRVLLAAHIIALYRVDRNWTTEYLLPLFDWQRSPSDARIAWEGFLWSPRIYPPLLAAIKESFLETAARYGDLGQHAEQYATFLTFVALESSDTFTTREMADAICHLPASGLECSAQALIRALEGAQDQRSEYWLNRVLPFLHSIWPKSRNSITPRISESLAQLCVAAHESFPEALQKLRHSLQPVQHSDYLIHRLVEAKLCDQFPEEALAFLGSIIGDNAQWVPIELKQCLNSIQKANQLLSNDARFIRLDELIGRRGMA